MFADIWSQRWGLRVVLLRPVAFVFAGLVALRRTLYRTEIFRSERLPVPVVVVGNITVGGAGKTPLVIALVQAFRQAGRHPGIVSRGYGADPQSGTEVTAVCDPAQVGDEPLLLAIRSGCPVFVGRDRVAAAKALLRAHPECDLIVSDDGLQHYRLQRDFEIAVFDERGVMNGLPLPAGPLREPLHRLISVDAVVLNGVGTVSPAPTLELRLFQMSLGGDTFYRLDDPKIQCSRNELCDLELHAVAGIGAPQRFFDHLRGLQLNFYQHEFADHHIYHADELRFEGAVLTTEKDAVKLAHLGLSLPVWVLPVTAVINPDLSTFILERLNGCPTA